jgi:alpha-beta hydrolase superfamily lysophospholipase
MAQIADQDVDFEKHVPVTFSGLMGMLHVPRSEFARGVSVVLCPAVGRDARWTYRSLFLWADQLAEAGFHVLRYDHLGEGDSLNIGVDEDQWEAWTGGLKDAAAFCRSVTGNHRLVVAGIRIGATLAAVSAENIRPDGLILWDPIISGAAWLRELRLASAMIANNDSNPNIIEVNGLRLATSTLRSLEYVDLKQSAVFWPPTLISSLTVPKKLLTNLGETVTNVPFTGYAKLFKDSHVNEAPTELFEATAEWVSSHFSQRQHSGILIPKNRAVFVTDEWTEERVSFGGGLEGVLCLPIKQSTVKAFIFGNTGADPRAGVANFATRSSRILASKGVASLRLDFKGIGESAPMGTVHVYETNRTEDLQAANALLIAKGYSDTTITGICTGGFHAVRAVLEDGALPRALAINSWLVWQPGTRLDREALAESMRSVYLRTPVQARKWVRGLREGARSVVAPRLRAIRRQLLPSSATRSVRAEIKRASDRSVRIHVVVGQHDHAREGLEEFGKNGRWFAKQPGMSIKTITELDHALFSEKSQALALGELLRFAGCKY